MKLNTTHKRQLAIKLKQEKHNRNTEMRTSQQENSYNLNMKQITEKGMNKTNDWRKTM